MAEDQPSEIQVRRATSDDLRTLVEFNAAMALETEGMTLDVECLRAGVAAVLDGDSRGFYFVAEDSATVLAGISHIGSLQAQWAAQTRW